jgi:hypothetical protein
VTARRRLTGRVRVALPPAQAFRLFTPRGEQDWVHGWHPRFPAPADDDTAPGTVFETEAHGTKTTWVVASRTLGRSVSYVRLAGDATAGTVTVTLAAAGDRTEAEVAYDLTALTPQADAGLSAFADGYDAYLASWEEAISRHLDAAGSALPSGGPRANAAC